MAGFYIKCITGTKQVNVLNVALNVFEGNSTGTI